jgi:hypothetical protein
MASTLLDAVTGTLAQLPERVVTELTQAQVIVDARKSTDNQAVRGTLDRSQPGGPVNAVVAKNARFRTSGVRPGDQIRYFALQTSELIEEYRRGTSSTADISEDMMFELATGNDVGATNYKPIVFPVLEVASETELVTFPLNVAEPTTELFEVQVWRNSSERYTQLQRDLGLYANRGLPRLGWQPSPDRAALEQIVERLNQWLLQGEPDVDWQMPQLLAQLPQALASDAKLARLIDESALTRSAFSVSATDRELLQAAAYEGQLLQEAQWCPAFVSLGCWQYPARTRRSVCAAAATLEHAAVWSGHCRKSGLGVCRNVPPTWLDSRGDCGAGNGRRYCRCGQHRVVRRRNCRRHLSFRSATRVDTIGRWQASHAATIAAATRVAAAIRFAEPALSGSRGRCRTNGRLCGGRSVSIESPR